LAGREQGGKKMKGDGVYDTFVWGQCRLQSLVEPGRLWRGSNARTTLFEVTGSPQEVTEALAHLPAKLDRTLVNKFTKNKMRWKLESHSGGKAVTLLVLTPKWLDKVTFTVAHGGSDGRCVVRAFARSTGFLPVVWPLSWLLNICLFWVPFTDALGEMSWFISNEALKASQLDHTFLETNRPRKNGSSSTTHQSNL